MSRRSDEKKRLLRKHNNACQICHTGDIRLYVYHIDKNIHNYIPHNIMLLCEDCRRHVRKHGALIEEKEPVVINSPATTVPNPYPDVPYIAADPKIFGFVGYTHYRMSYGDYMAQQAQK